MTVEIVSSIERKQKDISSDLKARAAEYGVTLDDERLANLVDMASEYESAHEQGQELSYYDEVHGLQVGYPVI